MKKNITILLSFIFLNSFGQKKSDAIQTYDLAVNYFREGKLREADSLFTISLQLEPNVDTYYNKALVSKKLDKFNEYCINLEYAKWHGDSEAGKLFNSDCNSFDSIFVTEDYKNATAESYFYKLKFVKSKYSSHQEFYRYDFKNLLNLAYEINNTDTSYIKLPKAIEDSITANIMNPINKIHRTNMKYPQAEKEMGIAGTVYIQFYVNKLGQTENIKVMRAPTGGSGLTKEVLRIMQLLPNFKPLIYQGNPINLKLILPVKFTLR